jgi:phage repressor protein C with HTH and peptisase S24 domain
MSLGQVIRQQRENLGLTLDEVSRRTGYSKPYLSTIETNRTKNPPADELLVRLEKILEFEPGLLIHIAHMEKLPADVRKAFEDSRAENEEWRSLIQHVIQEGADLSEKIQSDHYQHLLNKSKNNYKTVNSAGRLVPVINNVTAGYPMDYDDKGYPPGGADEYVRCPDLHDPNAFAVRVIGDSMEPKYHQGDIIIFSPAMGANSGDDCFVRMTDPHETTFKQVFFLPDEPTIRLQPRNHKYPPLILPRERINGLWKAAIRYERLAT